MDNRDDQEDLFQEIICQLWKANDSFKGESQFSTWMYRVAINTAIVFLKKEKKKVDKYELSSTNIPDEEEMPISRSANWNTFIGPFKNWRR